MVTSTQALAELPVARAEMVEAPRMRQFDGVVEAVHRATVSAQTAGRIAELPFDVDDFVPAGEVLVRFRDVEQQARLKSAQADWDEARAREAEGSSELQRVADLYERKLISKAALDRAKASAKSAVARVAAARARVEQAEEQLAHTLVRAPYAGIVVERHVEVGESANVGQPLMTGLSLDRLRVSINVPQSLVGQLELAGAAQVRLPGGELVRLEKLTIFPFADPASHTVRVRGEFPVSVENIFPGMYLKVAIPVGTQTELLIPAAAVARRSEVTAVYTLDAQGKLGFRQVRLGALFGERVAVLSGLAAGERVVLDPIAAAGELKAQRGAAQ
jgi:RND family efflux transporter MFP subunit